jgi:arylsulfatase
MMRAAVASLRIAAARAAILLVLVAGASACRGQSKTSLVLVTIDTLRADHLGSYGYGRPTSPHLDGLARQGLLFERAFTTLPRTTQGIGSILTGRYPKSHGARGLFMRLPETNLTLAEALRGAGYATAAAVSNTFLRPGQGFEQGFDRYDNPDARWDGDSAEKVTASAVRLLEDLSATGRPFFLWVHYLDPHWRYEPGPPFDAAFDPGFAGPLTVYSDLDAGRITKGRLIFDPPLDARQKEHIVALYDGEIARTDAALAPLLARLDRLTGPLLTVVTSDHGESLGEHGYHFAHGETLYEGSLRVPLLFRLPGRLAAGSRSRALAENVDIAPTILALLGVDRLQGVEGRPLVTPGGGPGNGSGGAMAPVSPGRAFVHAESDFQLIHPENPRYYIPGPRGRWTSSSDGHFKLILIPIPGGEILELYDLETDPRETTNRIDDPALEETRQRLLLEVKRFADYGAAAAPPGTEGLTPEQEERLRSLGYIN